MDEKTEKPLPPARDLLIKKGLFAKKCFSISVCSPVCYFLVFQVMPHLEADTMGIFMSSIVFAICFAGLCCGLIAIKVGLSARGWAKPWIVLSAVLMPIMLAAFAHSMVWFVRITLGLEF